MKDFADLIDDHALTGLRDELMLEHKPGLVTPTACGSHADMDVHTFDVSIAALRGYFGDCVRLGASDCSFRALQSRGLRAEQAMFAATGGINTHKGAIFTLGLLSAATGWQLRRHGSVRADLLGRVVAQRWGAEIAIAAAALDIAPDMTHGRRVRIETGLPGAREQAIAGFPVLGGTTYRELRAALRRGANHERAGLHALLSTMAALPDTNLAHRGGRVGLAWAQAQAHDFLARGGVFAADWRSRLRRLCAAFEARWLSPGGSADLLAAAWAMHRFDMMFSTCDPYPDALRDPHQRVAQPAPEEGVAT